MMAEEDEKKPSGCGLTVLYSSIFRRRSQPPRRSASAGSSPHCGPNAVTVAHSNSKRRRSGSDDAMIVPVMAEPPVVRSHPNAKGPIVPCYQNVKGRRPQEPAKVAPGPPGRLQSFGLTNELDNVLYDHQRAKESSGLVRASSGNVMLFGNLGNLRGSDKINAAPPNCNPPKMSREQCPNPNGKYGTNGLIENLAKSNDEEPVAPVLCRALSRRLDPEELKEMGNEEYKKGRFAEALAFYDRAIILDPRRASLYSNKAAALIGLGQLLDAVTECNIAVKIEPSYARAHHRLATLYLRLGEAEKAMHHYKLSGNEAGSTDIARAQTLQTHLTKCNEARRLRDWHTMLEESQFAISAGADSASQVFASQAEALMKLQRHEDADSALIDAPTFQFDTSTAFFGAAASAYVLSIRSQVDMSLGRFDEAVSSAKLSVQLDSSNKEVVAVGRRARAVASARAKGNELFKASKFEYACIAYGEGLDHDSHNSVLLCNRAACHAKLGQLEKAVEDCNVALKVRPSYNKARLRRAECYAKLKRWEESIKDYELLIQETPGNEEVRNALLEAQIELEKENGDVKDMNCGTNVVVNITANNQFKSIIMSSGLSVIFFCDKSSEAKQMMTLIQQLCRQYPSVCFLKVDRGDNPNIVESEGVTRFPTLVIYKNGSKVKDIFGSDYDSLESSLNEHGCNI